MKGIIALLLDLVWSWNQKRQKLDIQWVLPYRMERDIQGTMICWLAFGSGTLVGLGGMVMHESQVMCELHYTRASGTFVLPSVRGTWHYFAAEDYSRNLKKVLQEGIERSKANDALYSYREMAPTCVKARDSSARCPLRLVYRNQGKSNVNEIWARLRACPPAPS
jgi:hypothetical protein